MCGRLCVLVCVLAAALCAKGLLIKCSQAVTGLKALKWLCQSQLNAIITGWKTETLLQEMSRAHTHQHRSAPSDLILHQVLIIKWNRIR